VRGREARKGAESVGSWSVPDQGDEATVGGLGGVGPETALLEHGVQVDGFSVGVSLKSGSWRQRGECLKDPDHRFRRFESPRIENDNAFVHGVEFAERRGGLALTEVNAGRCRRSE